MADPGSGGDIWTILISATIGAIVAFFGSLVMQGRLRWRETQIYGAALVREMLLITRKLNTYRDELRAFRKKLEGTVPKSPLNDDDLLVHRSNTSKIGLLDKPYALSTLKFYQWVRDLRAVAEGTWNHEEPRWIDKDTKHVADDWNEEFTEHLAQVERVREYGTSLLSSLEDITSLSYPRRIASLAIVKLRPKQQPPE